eukprot:scaffold1667_cov258-Pinguiococcus_pyrenoidosus.AAC.19
MKPAAFAEPRIRTVLLELLDCRLGEVQRNGAEPARDGCPSSEKTGSRNPHAIEAKRREAKGREGN